MCGLWVWVVGEMMVRGCWANDSSFGVVGHPGEIKGNVWVLVVGEMMVRGCWAEKCAACGCGLLGK